MSSYSQYAGKTWRDTILPSPASSLPTSVTDFDDIQNLEKDLSSLRKEMSQYKLNIEKVYNNKLSSLVRDKNYVQEELDKREDADKEKKYENKLLQDKVFQLGSKLQNITDQYSTLMNTHNQTVGRLKEYEEKNDKLYQQLQYNVNNLTRVSTVETQQQKTKINTLTNTLDSRLKDIHHLEVEVNKERDTNRVTREEVTRLDLTLTQMRNENQELKLKHEHAEKYLRGIVEELRKENFEQKQLIDKMKGDLDLALRREYEIEKRKQEHIHEVELQKKELQLAIEKLSQQVEQKTKENNALQHRYEKDTQLKDQVLSQTMQDYERQIRDLREQVQHQEAENKKLMEQKQTQETNLNATITELKTQIAKHEERDLQNHQTKERMAKEINQLQQQMVDQLDQLRKHHKDEVTSLQAVNQQQHERIHQLLEANSGLKLVQEQQSHTISTLQSQLETAKQLCEQEVQRSTTLSAQYRLFEQQMKTKFKAYHESIVRNFQERRHTKLLIQAWYIWKCALLRKVIEYLEKKPLAVEEYVQTEKPLCFDQIINTDDISKEFVNAEVNTIAVETENTDTMTDPYIFEVLNEDDELSDHAYEPPNEEVLADHEWMATPLPSPTTFQQTGSTSQSQSIIPDRLNRSDNSASMAPEVEPRTNRPQTSRVFKPPISRSGSSGNVAVTSSIGSVTSAGSTSGYKPAPAAPFNPNSRKEPSSVSSSLRSSTMVVEPGLKITTVSPPKMRETSVYHVRPKSPPFMPSPTPMELSYLNASMPVRKIDARELELIANRNKKKRPTTPTSTLAAARQQQQQMQRQRKVSFTGTL